MKNVLDVVMEAGEVVAGEFEKVAIGDGVGSEGRFFARDEEVKVK